ncbi:hypothetical protein FOCC_FOCC006984, partial [Frankliniella occidentalis]
CVLGWIFHSVKIKSLHCKIIGTMIFELALYFRKHFRKDATPVSAREPPPPLSLSVSPTHSERHLPVNSRRQRLIGAPLRCLIYRGPRRARASVSCDQPDQHHVLPPPPLPPRPGGLRRGRVHRPGQRRQQRPRPPRRAPAQRQQRPGGARGRRLPQDAEQRRQGQQRPECHLRRRVPL